MLAIRSVKIAKFKSNSCCLFFSALILASYLSISKLYCFIAKLFLSISEFVVFIFSSILAISSSITSIAKAEYK